MITAAFQRAQEGQLCTICSKRVAHAIFQRHRDACKINPIDNDVIFVSANEIPANKFFMTEMKVSATQINSNTIISQQPSTSKTQFNGRRYSTDVVKVTKKIKKEPKRRSVEITPKIQEYFVSDSDCNNFLNYM